MRSLRCADRIVCVSLMALMALGCLHATVSAQFLGDVQPYVEVPEVRSKRTPAGRPAVKQLDEEGPIVGKAQVKRRQVTPPRRTVRPPATPDPALAAPKPAEQRQLMLLPVRSWAYQLRRIDFDEVARSPFDLVVIDHALASGRRFQRQFDKDLVRQIQQRPNGGRRLVLAYLSIGEAERYRFYWQQEWYDTQKRPKWLGPMNTVWDGNYLVRYWDPEWQKLIFGTPESYLERIKAAGFDGIYVDRADVYFDWAKENRNAEKDMVAFLSNLSQAARADDPYFLVVMQNAEELIAHKPVVEAIDAIAKEDLLFGIDHNAKPNDAENINWSIEKLREAKAAGRKVFVVEYLGDPEKAASARRRIEKEGFVAHFTSRDLGELSVIAPDQRATSVPASPPPALPQRH